MCRLRTISRLLITQHGNVISCNAQQAPCSKLPLALGMFEGTVVGKISLLPGQRCFFQTQQVRARWGSSVEQVACSECVQPQRDRRRSAAEKCFYQLTAFTISIVQFKSNSAFVRSGCAGALANI